MTYEPYLSTVRAKPEAGKIIATTLDYPMVMDTFGCTPKFLAENPKAAKALADSYFEAVEMIKNDPKKSFEIMGADVKQTGEQFEASRPSTCAGRTARRTRSSSPASTRIQQGSRRPAAGGRHHQAAARHAKLADTRSSSRRAAATRRSAPPRATARGASIGAAAAHADEAARCPSSPARAVALGIAFFVALRRAVGVGDLRRLRLEDVPRRSRSRCCARARRCSPSTASLKDIGMTVWRVLGGFVARRACSPCRSASRWARTSRSRRSSSRSCRSRATCRRPRSFRC